jgi:hypothetical protein
MCSQRYEIIIPLPPKITTQYIFLRKFLLADFLFIVDWYIGFFATFFFRLSCS